MPVPKGSTKPRKSPLKLVPPGAKAPSRAPRRARLAPPAHLAEDEAAAWRELVAEPAIARVLDTSDRWALESLATLIADRRRLRAAINSRPAAERLTYTTTTETGSLMERPHPEPQMLATIGRELWGALGRFGLSPADRSRVIAKDEADGSDPEGEFRV
jgi:phage terminase small subunit